MRDRDDIGARDGWFRTRYLARRDHDGYYVIVDRTKDLNLRGGFNVCPHELDEVLKTHPSVSLAAIVGGMRERVAATSARTSSSSARRLP